jgi:hypothetical protein
VGYYCNYFLNFMLIELSSLSLSSDATSGNFSLNSGVFFRKYKCVWERDGKSVSW